MKKDKMLCKVVVISLLLGGCLLTACGDDGEVSVPPASEGNVGQVVASGEAVSEATGQPMETSTAVATTAEPQQEEPNVQEPVSTEMPTQEPIFTEVPTQEPTTAEEPTQEPAPTEVPTEEPTQEPASTEAPGTVQIVISATGDVTLGNYLGQGYANSFDDTYEQGVGDGYFFENVAAIFEADDLTLVNLEGPLTNSEDPREGPTFTISGDPKYVNILTEGNVEAVSMANNHRLDYKEKGTEDTVAALTEAGIVYAYDRVVGIYEIEGIQVGMVSVNEVNDGWLVEAMIQDGIAKLKEAGADLILVSCHWGVEKENYPEEYQTKLGKKCVEWGADLVIGHHPHVLQGIEEYKGKYIIYSLGNFCFGANRNPSDKDCMIYQQTFTFVEGALQEDKDIRVIPCSVSSTSKRNDYKPTPAQGEEAARIIGRINEFSKDFGLAFDEEGCLIQQEADSAGN